MMSDFGKKPKRQVTFGSTFVRFSINSTISMTYGRTFPTLKSALKVPLIGKFVR